MCALPRAPSDRLSRIGDRELNGAATVRARRGLSSVATSRFSARELPLLAGPAVSRPAGNAPPFALIQAELPWEFPVRGA
jgi:hypothetical protein